MAETRQQVKVTIPATTANLGPGFDCLGLALGLHNEICLTAVSQAGLIVEVDGEGAGRIPTDGRNLAVQAAERLFELVGKRPSGLRVRQQNRIPVGSGLGSSAAATLGGLVAANALVGGGLSTDELLAEAVAVEGHPDNVVPAFFGGLTLSVMGDGRVQVEQIPFPALTVLIILPDCTLPTAQARAALPADVPLADAVFNLSRTGLLIRAFERGDYGLLAVAMEDKLHQPYRIPLVPGMAAAFEAAKNAGAAAVALSGAGPSLAVFASTGHEQIAQAVQAAFDHVGLSSRFWILPADQQGTVLISGEDTVGVRKDGS